MCEDYHWLKTLARSVLDDYLQELNDDYGGDREVSYEETVSEREDSCRKKSDRYFIYYCLNQAYFIQFYNLQQEFLGLIRTHQDNLWLGVERDFPQSPGFLERLVTVSGPYLTYIVIYSCYFVIALLVSPLREFLIEQNIVIFRYIASGMGMIFRFEFLQLLGLGIIAIAAAAAFVYGYMQLTEHLAATANLDTPDGVFRWFVTLALLILGVIALVYVTWALLIAFVVGFFLFFTLKYLGLYVVLPLASLGILFFLPGFVIVLIQYIHYLIVPHPAEAEIRCIAGQRQVDVHDPARVADKMYSVHPEREPLKWWWSYGPQKWRLRRIRELFAEEYETNADMEKYLRAKNQRNRMGR